MGDVKTLAEEFSGEQETIRELRSVDPVFDEICADYDTVCRELAALHSVAGLKITRAGHLRESLAGLRCEIEWALQASKPTAEQQRGPRQ